MKLNHWILFAIVGVMVLSTGGFLSYIQNNQKLGKPGVRLDATALYDTETNKVADTTVFLPERVSGYASQPMPVTKVELEVLPKDTIFGKRRYWTTNGWSADVNVVLMGQDRTSIHKPQFCLVGQGWAIEKSDIVHIPMARPISYDLPAMKLTTSIRIKDEAGNPRLIRGLYVYWFVADKKLTASHDARMWSMAKNLLQTGTLERWAYISYFSWCSPGQEEETFARMKEFIAKSAPDFQIPTGDPLKEPGHRIQTTSN